MPKYYIDFESWVIEAKTSDQACLIAEAKVKEGYHPAICGAEDGADDSHTEEYYGVKDA